MASPCIGVPLPAGNPAPLGSMLMSQDAISSEVASLPSSGPSASAADDMPSKAATAERERLRINMRQLPLFADGPAGDAIEVVNCFHSAIREQLRTRRL